MGNAIVGGMSEDEARKILHDAGVQGLRRMAGYVPRQKLVLQHVGEPSGLTD